MIFFRVLFKTAAVIVCAFAGNFLGGILRSLITGVPVQSIHYKHETREGWTIRNIPVITKFYPALLISFVGKPRWLFALLGGVVTGVLVDDRIEELLWELIGDQILKVDEGAVGSQELTLVEDELQ